MDDIWDSLCALKINIDQDKCRSNTDKKYAVNLSDGKTQGNLDCFYQAVEAMERGCGFPFNKEISTICEEAAAQDHLRFLEVVQKKPGMLEVISILYHTGRKVKLVWIGSNAISRPIVLFECIRQLLTYDTALDEEETKILANGICLLSLQLPDKFRYLLNRHILFNENFAGLFTKILEHLQAEGWESFSSVIDFSDVNPQNMHFLDNCARKLDWGRLYLPAQPLLTRWDAYLKKSVELGKFGMSLYNDASNMLITILVYLLDTPQSFESRFEAAVSSCERDMYRWFESTSQQRCVLLAYLSEMEHLRYVWMNNCAKYGVPFPEKLRLRALLILSEWRFLWDCSLLRDKAQKEAAQLKDWLEQVNT